ncbi:MAG: NAD(P)H-binding protein [Euryarchaeota archaeon]|nr:NAD(P)H-binding protein [Euryarchaeota archaeon]
MRVALAGGTGFVGRHLVEALVSRGHEVVLLAHERVPASGREVTVVPDAFGSDKTIRLAVRGADCVIDLVAIRRERPSKGLTAEANILKPALRLIDASLSEHVAQFVFMSANGVGAGVDTPYVAAKRGAEDAVRASGLRWTVFRPSFIIHPGGGIVAELRDMMLRTRVFPLFMTDARVQPVNVGDVASMIASSVGKAEADGMVFHVGGPETFRYKDLVRRIARSTGKTILLIPQPKSLALVGASILGGFGWFPATRDELTMLFAGNVAPEGECWKFFGMEPTPLPM